MIWTDPPYNVALEPQRKTHCGIMNDNVSKERHKKLISETLVECYRILKANSPIWICCNWQCASIFDELIQTAGFKIITWVVWNKIQFGIGWHFRPQHEFIIVAAKGKLKPPETSLSNLWSIPRLTKTLHPTEKPLELIRRSLSVYNKPGDMVVDPFLGSGSTYIAAKEMGMSCCGIELDPNYFKLITDRINQRISREEGMPFLEWITN